MSPRPSKLEPTVESPASHTLATIYEFLVSELPPKNARHVSWFSDAVREAGERYDRYNERKDEWSSYAARRRKLEGIVNSAEKLASGLSELDILSHDDLEVRVGSKELDGVIGSLRRLGKEAAFLVRQIQPTGRGRDLAEERWILELAGIYEDAFCQPATVWGAEGGSFNGRRSFCRFLEVSRPLRLRRLGMLHPRQVDRVLERRRPPRDS